MIDVVTLIVALLALALATSAFWNVEGNVIRGGARLAAGLLVFALLAVVLARIFS